NQIKAFNDASGAGHYLDTIGRDIYFGKTVGLPGISASIAGCPSGSLAVTSAMAWTIPGPNGVNVTYTFCFANLNLQSNFRVLDTYTGQYVHEASGAVGVVQSVVLPNGTAWKFEYNDRDPGDAGSVNYGGITKITFPTGGSVSYAYTSYSILYGT